MNKQNNIETLIYEIGGQLVMLDSDLVQLYGYKDGSKSVNKAIKRKEEYFTDNVYFQLSKKEWNNLRFQLGTSSYTSNQYGGRRYIPNVFTLEEIKILSTILKKPDVLSITNSIIDAFNNLQNKNHPTLQIALSKREKTEDLIYFIRGKQVMLDFDLARIYNIFSSDIYFQLTDEEFDRSRFQFETLNTNGNYRGTNTKYLPYAFTEEGVYLLATIIRTIIKAFIALRQYVGETIINLSNMEEKNEQTK